jgi:CHAD domain-containing protein/CYTH domain-containing protein
MADDPPLRDYLEEPVQRAARLMALRLLDKVDAERKRLEDPKDTEALHDFRVAVRRLRSWLRAYKGPLRGSVSGKNRDALRAVARATNGPRDVQAHLEWLSARKELFGKDRRKGSEWLIEQLRARDGSATRTLGPQVDAGFLALRRKLAEKLQVYTRRVDDSAADVSFAVATARLVADQAEALRERITCVRGRGDKDASHQARIAAKHLRYLLEPVAQAVTQAGPLLPRLEELQDILGELHDAHVFAGEVSAAMAASPLRRFWPRKPDPRRPGLQAILEELERSIDESFARFATQWRGGAAREFWAGVADAAAALRARIAEDVAPRRRFLLSGLPRQLRGVRAVSIEQGYLPGDRLRERLVRVTSDGTTTFYRGMRVEVGARRAEVEERIAPSTFDRMWPLTKGRRLGLHRRRVPAGEVTWVVDEVAGRRMVLAEVSLPAKGGVVEPPDWLRPFVVREVTGEEPYQSRKLAR